jgi:hypothetical protein
VTISPQPVDLEADVRAFCEALPLSLIHIEIAVQEGRRAGCAEIGKVIAARISERVQKFRERFPLARL